MSWFFSSAAPVDPTAPTFFPVSTRPEGEKQLFGALEPTDTEWACHGGFATETQIFYQTLEDGTFVMVQIIHASIGVWYPNIQLTAKLYNPTTKKLTWKSVNVTNFTVGPAGTDKRSSKGDQFSFTYKATPEDKESPEKYVVHANFDTELQISLDIVRPTGAQGWKIGSGPEGGFSYFGADRANPEGSVVHRFWPHTRCSGLIIHDGAALEAKGPGMFVHAIQGMRPNLIASRWDFANFQSTEHNGVSAVQMSFKTCDAHGRNGAGSGGVVVNIGSIVLGGQLVSVTAETQWPDEAQEVDPPVISRSLHLKPELDEETQYQVPTGLLFTWAAPTIQNGERISASLQLDTGTPTEPKDLVERVDILAEIPYVIKTMVSYVAGTKPYIYQYLQKSKLVLTGPDSVFPGLSGGLQVDGITYSEATFIS